MSDFDVERAGAYPVVGLNPVRSARDLDELRLAKYSNALGFSPGRPLKFALEVLRFPSVYLTEQKLGGAIASAGQKAGLWDVSWDDPQSRVFRYHNTWLFNHTASLMWAAKEAAVRGDLIHVHGLPMPDPSATMRIWQNEGHQWAKDNPKAVDQIVEAGLDPLWFATPMLRAFQGASAAAEVSKLEGVAAAIRSTMKSGGANSLADSLLHLSATSGGPLSKDVVAMINKAPSDEAAASLIYGLGFRGANSTNPIAHFVNEAWSARPNFFRRPTELYAPEISDLAKTLPEIQRTQIRNYQVALQRIEREMPQLTRGDMESVNEILQNVQRPVGLAPNDVGPYVEHRVHQMVTSGEWGQLGLHPATPESIRAGGIASSELKAGWLPGTKYREAYAPAALREVDKETRSVLERMAPDTEASAAWRKPRTAANANLPNREELNRWLAKVRTREQGKAFYDNFIAQLAQRQKDLELIPNSPRTQAALEDLSKMRAALTQFRKTYGDNVAAAKALKYWNGFLGAFKGAQLGYNPAWYFHVLRDGALKNYITAGSSDVLSHTPSLRRITGELMSTENIIPKMSTGEPELSKIGEWAHQAHDLGRKKLLSYAYNQKASELVGKGFDTDTADRAAFDYAKGLVAKTHFDWDHALGIEHGLKQLFPYAHYYLENFNWYGQKALEYPSETNALINARQFQVDHLAINKHGDLAIPGTDQAFDPMRLASFNVMMRAMTDPNSVFKPTDEPWVKTIKTAQVAVSPFAPPLQAMAGADKKPVLQTMAEAIPAYRFAEALDRAQTKPIDPQKDFSDLHANTLRGEFVPGREMTDPAKGISLVPNRLNDPVRLWNINREMAAAQADGKQLSFDDAAKAVDQQSAKAGALGFTLGIFPTRTTPGHVKLDDEIGQYVNDFKGQPGAAAGREVFLNDHPYLKGLVPKYPDAEPNVINIIERLKRGEPYEKIKADIDTLPLYQKQSMLEQAPQGLLEKAKDVLGNLHNPFVAEASAEEIPKTKLTPEDLKNNGQLFPSTGTFTRDSGQMFREPIADIQKRYQDMGWTKREANTMAYTHAAYEDAYFKKTVDTLGKTNTREGQMKVLNGLPENVRPAFQQYLQTSQGDLQSKVRALLDNPDTANAPYNVVKNETGLSHLYRNWLSSAKDGNEFNRRANLNDPAQIQKELSHAGQTEGLDLTGFDSRMLDVARRDIGSAGMYAMGKAVMGSANAAYATRNPAEQAAIGQLQGAIRRPQALEPMLASIQDKMDHGALSPSFWDHVQSNNPELYDNVAIHSQMGTLQRVAHSISVFDSKGNIVDINPLRLDYLRDHGYGHFIDALREGYGDPRLANKLAGVNEPDRGVVDHDATVGKFREEFALTHQQQLTPLLQHLSQPTNFVEAYKPSYLAALNPTSASQQDFRVDRDAGVAGKLSTPVPGFLSNAPLTVPSQPYGTGGQYISDVIRSTASYNQNLAPDDPTRISLMEMAEIKLHDGNGNLTMDPSTAFNSARGLYQLSNTFGLNDPTAPTALNKSMSGLAVGTSTFLTLSSFGVPPQISLPVAAVAGIGQGLGWWGKKKGPDDSARQAYLAQLAAERAQQEAERQAATDARDISTTARDLSSSITSEQQRSSFANRYTLQQQLNFTRKPTFQSSQGLVAAAERAMTQQLKPIY